MSTKIVEPTVWAGCLACYNEGRLTGHWFGVTEIGDVGMAEIHRGTNVDWKRENHEEPWIFDTSDLPISKEMDLMEAARWGEVYEEAGDDWPAVAAWVASGDYIAEAHSDIPVLTDWTDRYRGCWPDFKTFAYQLAEDLNMFEGLEEESDVVRYFGWDAWIRDLEMGYSVVNAPDYSVFVFESL
ncbi:MAG: antirestriction protein ArdA [Gordonia sp. (in: high G+C Gram-positive bacteria)]